MIQLNKSARVLFLSPHTDDVELSCGGTLATLAKLGCELRYVAFSACEQSVPEGFPKDVLEKETRAATQTLGIGPDCVDVLKFPVRYFERERQEILEYLIKLRKEFRPTVVFSPSIYDVHQDHKTICEECERAFRGSSILGYEVPWNNFSSRHDLFVPLDQDVLEAKVEALSCFKSQGFRTYFSNEYVSSLARVRGQQAGYEFAEAFTVTRIRLDL